MGDDEGGHPRDAIGGVLLVVRHLEELVVLDNLGHLLERRERLHNEDGDGDQGLDVFADHVFQGTEEVDLALVDLEGCSGVGGGKGRGGGGAGGWSFLRGSPALGQQNIGDPSTGSYLFPSLLGPIGIRYLDIRVQTERADGRKRRARGELSSDRYSWGITSRIGDDSGLFYRR